MRAYVGDQCAIAVAGRAEADMYVTGVVRVCDVVGSSREIPELVHHIARGGVAGQPLNVPAQELGECRDIPVRGLQTAFFGDESGPGCQDRTDRGAYLGGGRTYRVGSGTLSRGLSYHAHHFRFCASVAVGVQRG